MLRPLFNHAIAKLEALFVESKTNIHALKKLEHELQHRQTPRAGSLLAKVKAALHDAASGPAPTQSPAFEPATSSQSKSPQSVLLQEPVVADPVTPKVSPTQSSVARGVPIERTGIVVTPPSSSNAPANLASPAPATSVDDAYKILKAMPSSSWESVEQARRHLVQQTHPGYQAGVSEERRAQLQIEANRINAAYAILWQQKLSAFSS